MKATCSKCGEYLEYQRIGRQRYCLKCHAAHSRAHRKSHAEMSAEQRQRSIARAYANTYQRRGKLIPKGCEICGRKAQKHHEDYSKPLEVRWLCRDHHLILHNRKSNK